MSALWSTVRALAYAAIIASGAVVIAWTVQLLVAQSATDNDSMVPARAAMHVTTIPVRKVAAEKRTASLADVNPTKASRKSEVPDSRERPARFHRPSKGRHGTSTTEEAPVSGALRHTKVPRRRDSPGGGRSLVEVGRKGSASLRCRQARRLQAGGFVLRRSERLQTCEAGGTGCCSSRVIDSPNSGQGRVAAAPSTAPCSSSGGPTSAHPSAQRTRGARTPAMARGGLSAPRTTGVMRAAKLRVDRECGSNRRVVTAGETALLQSGAAVAQQAHNLEVPGSNPGSATPPAASAEGVPHVVRRDGGVCRFRVLGTLVDASALERRNGEKLPVVTAGETALSLGSSMVEQAQGATARSVPEPLSVCGRPDRPTRSMGGRRLGDAGDGGSTPSREAVPAAMRCAGLTNTDPRARRELGTYSASFHLTAARTGDVPQLTSGQVPQDSGEIAQADSGYDQRRELAAAKSRVGNPGVGSMPTGETSRRAS